MASWLALASLPNGRADVTLSSDGCSCNAGSVSLAPRCLSSVILADRSLTTTAKVLWLRDTNSLFGLVDLLLGFLLDFAQQHFSLEEPNRRQVIISADSFRFSK